MDWRQRAQIGDDLPSLVVGQSAPLRHPLVGIAVQEHPCELTVGGVANTLGAQAWTIGTAVGVGRVALGAVPEEKLVTRCNGLGIVCERISPRAVFIRYSMKPFTIEDSGLRRGDNAVGRSEECKSGDDNRGEAAKRS